MVTIDQAETRNRTDAELFVPAGMRRIRVEATGMMPVERVCSVKPGVTTTFAAILGRAASTAECR